MLTKKQNVLETIKGGNPDRFVNQYEYLNLILEAPTFGFMPVPGEMMRDDWGVTWNWPEGQIGPFPVHDEEHKVLKDITEWRKYVKAPFVPLTDQAWAPAIEHANSVNRDEEFVTAFYGPGLFEMTHMLMGMEDALIAFYEEPETMHELIEYITEHELCCAKILIEKICPNALFHHDDWGSQINSFLSPEMFKTFFVPAYKKIYNYYKANGIELIVHHSDCYAANLVPFMIDMGIDIWQGVMRTNNISELIKNYGGKISFMGGLHSGEIDFPGWTLENCRKHVEEACRSFGKHYFIPSLTSGLPMSSFLGVYNTVSQEINRTSKELF